jgi:hypothetical protein
MSRSESQESYPQMSLPVKVRTENRMVFLWKKALLSFRYSGAYLVLFHPLLWVNIGVLVSTYGGLLYFFSEFGDSLFGVFPHGYFGQLTQVRDWALIFQLVFVSLVIVLCLVVTRNGKSSLVTYLLLILLVLQLYVAKLLLLPVLLLAI